ncbi:MAG: hypothetical protein EOL87_09345 [Spartobacteria bacterium]|nr:hypothetical protein [Spartobacteria bacterium]
MSRVNERMWTCLVWSIMGCTLFLPLSVAVTEPLVFLSVLVLVLLSIREPSVWPALRSNVLLIPVVLFVGVTVVVSLLWGVRPLQSVSKFHRLLFLGLVWAVPLADRFYADRRSSLFWAKRLAFCFVVGTTVLGLFDLVRIPWLTLQGGDLFDAGNMRDPQFFMVSLVGLYAMLLIGHTRFKMSWWLLSLGANAAGLILHFKRGVWLSFCIVFALLVVHSRKWRFIAAMMLAVVALAAVPQVRERLTALKDVTTVKEGGRYLLWTEVAPVLFEKYPMGMGWVAVTHDDFIENTPHPVQPRLNHLHNNLLEMRLELGWSGLIAWLIMILSAMVLQLRMFFSKQWADASGPWMATTCTLALGGLLLDGMVESNFRDGEIMVLFCLLMGWTVLLWNAFKENRSVEG